MSSTAVSLVIQYLVVSLLSLFLLQFLADSKVTADVKLSVFLSWSLGFMGLILLPYDISSNIVSTEDEASIDELAPIWTTLYWFTFLLAWIALPLQLEYHCSGGFSFKEKLIGAARANLWYYFLVMGAGGGYIVYESLSNGISPIGVWHFLMALGNTYGVLLLVVLAGNGLVILPVRLWTMADADRALRTLYISAVRVEADFQMARFDLEQCEAQVERMSEALRVNTDTHNENQVILRDHVKTLLGSIAKNHDEDDRRQHGLTIVSKAAVAEGRERTKGRVVGTAFGNGGAAEEEDEPITKESFVEVHRKLKALQVCCDSCERNWTQLISSIQSYSEALAIRESMQHMPTESLEMLYNASILTKISRYARSLCSRITGLTSMQPILVRGCAVVLGVLSALIFWSELLLSTHWRSPVGMLMGIYSEPRTASSSLFVFSLTFVSYLGVCSYYSLFSLTGLAGPQQSATFSLIFNAEYATRLQFSLGYNFVLLVNSSRLEQTSFQVIVQRMSTLPVFGTNMQIYLPITMVIVGLVTWFNWHQRLLSFLPGFEDSSHVDDDDDPDEQVRMGKMLVASVTRRTSYANSNSNGIVEGDGENKLRVEMLGHSRLQVNNVPVVGRHSFGIGGSGYEFVGSSYINAEEEGEEDLDIGLRETIIHNPTRAISTGSSSCMEVEEDEIVFAGRYSGL